MGIYVPDLRMPESCEKCYFSGSSHDALCCTLTGNYVPFDYDIEENCPLIEIETPHGRLIDVDTLEHDTEFEKYCDCYISYSDTAIELAETILSAEK